jgi:hypothetical protein
MGESAMKFKVKREERRRRNLSENNAFGYFGHTGCARQRGFQALLHPRLARSLEGRRGSIAPVLPKIHGVGLHVHRARATMPRGLLT